MFGFTKWMYNVSAGFFASTSESPVSEHTLLSWLLALSDKSGAVLEKFNRNFRELLDTLSHYSISGSCRIWKRRSVFITYAVSWAAHDPDYGAPKSSQLTLTVCSMSCVEYLSHEAQKPVSFLLLLNRLMLFSFSSLRLKTQEVVQGIPFK